jgi:hypothetical protein
VPPKRVPATVTWGLLIAWAVHDAEELITIPRWVDRANPRLGRRLPGVPAGTWARLSTSQSHTTLAIGLMGGLIAAAAADGARTDGHSPFYQAVLTGFGVHAAVPHLASAVVTGGYTPGLLTAPTVVAPFSWWAWRKLRAAGVDQAKIPPAALVFIPVSIGAAHAGAAGLLRLYRRLSRTRAA